jgi:hypothetical protein
LQQIIVAIGKSALEDDVLSLNPPRFFQGLGKRVEKAARFGRLGACDKKKTKAAACGCGLLRQRGTRPSEDGTAHDRDEITPSHRLPQCSGQVIKRANLAHRRRPYEFGSDQFKQPVDLG